jgi:hypothetical protein
MKSDTPFIENLKVRADSWHASQVSGYAAVRWIADGKDQLLSSGSVVIYSVLIPAPSHALVLEFFAKADSKEFEVLQPQFDAIVDSLSLNLK